MHVSVSSLTRLLCEPINAFLESQMAINRSTRKVVERYSQSPDLCVKTPHKDGTCQIRIPALTIAHVPSFAHKRMRVCMHVRAKKKRGRTVFHLANRAKRNAQYKISFTIEATSSPGMQHLQQHLSEQIAVHAHAG